jgi:ubiquitin carboxyl-terminal hydrolase 17
VPKDTNLLILDLQDVFEHMHTMNATKKQLKAEVLTVNTKKLMKRIKAMN